jgi:thiamine-phosphate pyrophosphorylase
MSEAHGPLGLADRRLYFCAPFRDDTEHVVEAAIAGGVDIVQLRAKDRSDAEVARLAERLAERCRAQSVPFIVNDRPDIAAWVGADGVHLGQDDLPPPAARRLLGTRAILGRSTHDIGQADESADEPVDYISVGPVVPTPTKPGRPGIGPEPLRHAAAHVRRPWFVTGDVRPERVDDLVAAGARRFVVVRWIVQADDPEQAASTLRRAIDDALTRVGDDEHAS